MRIYSQRQKYLFTYNLLRINSQLQQNMKTNTLKILNTVALGTVLTVNYLANALPINGIKSNVPSDKNYNEFAPAGITFAIWGVIYTLLIAVIIWQFIGKNRAKDEAIGKISTLFILNCVFNAGWLFLWHYELLPISIIVMIGILFTLVRLNTVISHNLAPETPTRALLKAGFGVYLGWICVATIANVTTWLVSIKWSAFGLSPTFWTGGLIGIGALIVAFTTWRLRNMFIGLAVLWAFLGIIIRQNQLHDAFTPISWAALTWAMPIIASIFYSRTFKY